MDNHKRNVQGGARMTLTSRGYVTPVVVVEGVKDGCLRVRPFFSGGRGLEIRLQPTLILKLDWKRHELQHPGGLFTGRFKVSG
jgi:hypothetical protein